MKNIKAYIYNPGVAKCFKFPERYQCDKYQMALHCGGVYLTEHYLFRKIQKGLNFKVTEASNNCKSLKLSVLVNSKFAHFKLC